MTLTFTGQATAGLLDSTSDETFRSTKTGTTISWRNDSAEIFVSRNVTNASHWASSWDVPGDLLKVGNENGVQGYYAYDGLGRRLESKESSSTAWYAYLGTEVLLERFPSLQDNDYLYANGMRIPRIVCSAYSSPVTYYYHTDALGSTRLVTHYDKVVNVDFADNYQPYGQDNGTPTGSETYKFTGKPVSATTGLYYEYQRSYDRSARTGHNPRPT